ncbi:reverse transcriptase zinc-binding domain-containing protein [Artemisia annua]|uniref:Reverse transcriptase zinc-binding domain-containing protein n=1 Tax=Artemisia annua TaxID=35608 RepID=A0A2U1P7T8_ARTAN|nr:reverse transcriptase zinc-binding domain-containing protein [Artemisia annua]
MSTLSITSQSSLLLYGDEMKFSTNQAWKDIRGDDVHVPWEKLIWFTNCIPRHTFITWLAIKNKLMTQDKLIKWYPNKVMCCPLCKSMLDTHDHLFFQCQYSKEVWEAMKIKAKIQFNAGTWMETITEMSKFNNHSSIWTRLVTIKTRGTNCVTEVERAWDIRMQRMCDLNMKGGYNLHYEA